MIYIASRYTETSHALCASTKRNVKLAHKGRKWVHVSQVTLS